MFRSLVCALVASVALGQSQSQPVFRARGDNVRVFATVLDHDGRLVTTLTQPDFEVRDEGKPQPLTLFDNTPQPIRIVVMLDVSGSMAGNLSLLRSASSALFDRLRPDDLARVGTFGKDVQIGPSFTNDHRELLSALPSDIPPDAPTPLWRGLDAAMDTFGTEADERRVILVLTDGKDTGSMDFRHKPSSQGGVIDRARAENVMIYAVGMRSRFQHPMGMDLRQALVEDLPDPGLAKVAEETGGGYLEIKAGQDLDAAFARVADELHAQYLLGFAPPKHDGKIHKIDVRVTGNGFKLRARRSYVAPKE
jgi:Ca-activated chloride channel family protein